MASSTTSFKVSPILDDKNRARLESRSYQKLYTDIPNRALPQSYKEALGYIFKALTGEEFDPEASTFTVKADDKGTFQRIYAPALFSTENKELVIRWGDRDIPVAVSPGKIGVENVPKGTKFSFKDEKIGKYSEPVLSVSVTSNNTVFTLPVTIRRVDVKENLNADVLEAILDTDPATLGDKILQAPDLSKRGETTNYERMVGPYLKISALPVADYKVTSYRVKEDGKFGPEYYMQVQIDTPFVALVRKEVDGVWTEVESEITDWAIVKPNTALKGILAACPRISKETPATLKVLEHYTYNEKPAVKASLICQDFEQDADSLNLDF